MEEKKYNFLPIELSPHKSVVVHNIYIQFFWSYIPINYVNIKLIYQVYILYITD